MIVYQGESLKRMVDAVLDNEFKERFLLKDLHNYMVSKSDRKVCCLYGLKHTGKTVMMLQEVKKLNDYDHCIFVTCEDNDSIHQVKSVENANPVNPSCKYLFIDEATRTKDFIDTCAFLADAYAMLGVKVVLSGADSLCFYIALGNELYDRAHLLHTTYISFKEYNCLFGKSVDDYIVCGGTLTNGADNEFRNDETAASYADSAIAYNIFNAIHRWGIRGNYALSILYDIDERDELPSFIDEVLEYHNRIFLADVIARDLKSHDLGSLLQIVSQGEVSNELDSPAPVGLDELNDSIRLALGVKYAGFYTADKKATETVMLYLKAMDALYEVPKQWGLNDPSSTEYLSVQVGMRYCQAASFAKMLVDFEKFGKDFDADRREQILQRLDEIIRGGILEDVVFCQIAKANDNLAVSKYKNVIGQDVDILVLDKSAKAVFTIEVKYFDKMVDEQRKNLTNTEFCSEIERKAGMPIVNKAVVYRGENGENEDGVLYINASDFLIRSQEMVRVLLTHRNIKTFEELESLMSTNFFGNGADEQKVATPAQKKAEKPKFDRTDDDD